MSRNYSTCEEYGNEREYCGSAAISHAVYSSGTSLDASVTSKVFPNVCVKVITSLYRNSCRII